MQRDQMDLFIDVDTRPCADIIPIPPHRRQRLVESTAMQLLGKPNQKEADAYWLALIRELTRELRGYGVYEADIAGRMTQFQLAVQAVINLVMSPSSKTTDKDSA